MKRSSPTCWSPTEIEYLLLAIALSHAGTVASIALTMTIGLLCRLLMNDPD